MPKNDRATKKKKNPNFCSIPCLVCRKWSQAAQAGLCVLGMGTGMDSRIIPAFQTPSSKVWKGFFYGISQWEIGFWGLTLHCIQRICLQARKSENTSGELCNFSGFSTKVFKGIFFESPNSLLQHWRFGNAVMVQKFIPHLHKCHIWALR